MGSVTPPAKLSGGGLEEDIATHRTVDEQEIGHRDLLGPKVVEGVGLVNPSVRSRMACCGSIRIPPMPRGERAAASTELNGKGSVYQLGKQEISVAAVDGWRNVSAIPTKELYRKLRYIDCLSS